MIASLTAICRRFDFVRETQGANRGAWVELFQRFTNNAPGESWCCSFVCFCLDVATLGHSPYKKSGACQDLYAQAITAGQLVTTPAVDDLFFYVTDAEHAHHVGVVTGVNPLTGIAGNTSEDGLSTNGDGVHEHPLNTANTRFVRLPQ